MELGDRTINNGAHLLLGKDSRSANIAIFKAKLLVLLPVMPGGL
jgi:Na+-translocating ferredoxin:NAD+ oxidoreductase RnfE subunit